MKLNKRTGAILGFLLAVTGGATAATGWLTNYTWTFDTLKKEPIPAVLVTDDDDGTWTTVKTGTGLPVTGTVTTGDTNLGAKADSSATTDTGTFSLIALTKRVASHLTRLWQGPTASCAHYRGTTTSVSAGSSGTTVDAGATGTGYWTSVANLSRTYDIQIGLDTGSTRVPPGGSLTLSNPGAATADNVSVVTNCTGCGGAATNVSVVSCDDD